MKTTITEQATTDQQAGLSIMRGREQYVTVADRAAYMNAWLESMRVNGVPAAFVR